MLSRWLLVPGIVAIILYGIFFSIVFQLVDYPLFICKSTPCLFIFLRFLGIGIVVSKDELLPLPSLLLGRIIGIGLVGGIFFRIIPKGVFISVLVIDYVIGIVRFIFIFIIGIFIIAASLFGLLR